MLSLPVSLLALAAASASTSATPTGSSSNTGNAQKYQISKRGRTFADADGIFNPALFKEDKDHIAAKYQHGKAQYKRNLEAGKVQQRKRSEVIQPVHDISKLRARQSGGNRGSVELIDCASFMRLRGLRVSQWR